MAGRVGGFAAGSAAALFAAAMSLAPALQPVTKDLTIDIAGQSGGTIWAAADTGPVVLSFELAAAPALERAFPQIPVGARLAEQRLRNALTPEMAEHFRLLLYVDKSAHGALAQRMFVFDNRGAKLHLRYVWPISTGRERLETDSTGQRALTVTPAGYYELDPARFYRHYTSAHWNEAMPYAMFFAHVENGIKTGLAIHGAATGNERSRLGERASAGCVRLAPENARRLFELIQEHYHGPMPAPAFDPRSRSSSLAGVFARGRDGKLTLISGYQVLVLIDGGDGGKQVATLL